MVVGAWLTGWIGVALLWDAPIIVKIVLIPVVLFITVFVLSTSWDFWREG
jgi:hypothetical protein